MASVRIPSDLTAAYEAVARDLQAVFGPRLRAVVAFGPRIRTRLPATPRRSTVRGDSLALVDRVTMDDLVACCGHAERWARSGLQMPLLLGRDEFLGSLDAFPLEYDDIIAHHVLLVGSDPFAGVAVPPEDLRRACEARAKGHLLHLREAYLEARGQPPRLADAILASASPFSALLGNLARLQGREGDTVEARAAVFAEIADLSLRPVTQVLLVELEPDLSGEEASRLYPEYLATVERLVAWVDGWSKART